MSTCTYESQSTCTLTGHVENSEQIEKKNKASSWCMRYCKTLDQITAAVFFFEKVCRTEKTWNQTMSSSCQPVKLWKLRMIRNRMPDMGLHRRPAKQPQGKKQCRQAKTQGRRTQRGNNRQRRNNRKTLAYTVGQTAPRAQSSAQSVHSGPTCPAQGYQRRP